MLFDDIHAQLRRERKASVDWALASVKKSIELVVDEYDKVKVRAQERDPLSESDLRPEDFLDEATLSILVDLEIAYKKITARLTKSSIDIPFEIDSSS
jgi:hypothetical protein